jgi:ABC-type transport system involved in multi-copper enzyme maturation permease subunit
VTCFAAAGVAVAGVAHSANVAQAVSIATAVMLSMVSGVMGYGDMPAWADRIAQVFPVKPFKDALGKQFDPFATGAGWDLAALAVMASWALAAVLVARLTFRWDPVAAPAHRPRRPREARSANETRPAQRGDVLMAVPALEVGRPSVPALLADQAGWATRSALRDTAWVFFAIAFPLVQYIFSAAVSGGARDDTQATPPIGLQAATGMVAWGAMVTAMVFVPDAIARARDQGILKRLRGTALPSSVYFTGRFVSALLLVAATAVLILLAGTMWFELRLAWTGVALAAGLLVLGTATLAACGLLLVSVLPSSKAVTAVGLGLAVSLGFFSDVWAVGGLPPWMSAVGSVFPLKPLANSLSYALDPAGPTVSWLSVAVMTAWLAVTALLTRRLFRWSAT